MKTSIELRKKRKRQKKQYQRRKERHRVSLNKLTHSQLSNNNRANLRSRTRQIILQMIISPQMNLQVIRIRTSKMEEQVDSSNINKRVLKSKTKPTQFKWKY